VPRLNANFKTGTIIFSDETHVSLDASGDLDGVDDSGSPYTGTVTLTFTGTRQ